MKRVAAFLILAAVSAFAKDVQVGVLGLFHPKEVHVSAEQGRPLECGHTAGHQWQLQLVRSQMKITSEGRALVADSMACDDGHGGDAEFRVTVPGRISRHYRGKLEIKPAHGELLMIVTMDLETAVASVVAAESPPNAPMEALKAQAVAARSFLAAGGQRHHDFAFCDTTHCQFLRAPPSATSPAVQATNATRGLVLAYLDHAFAAMYSASCGGRTHSLEELGLRVRDYPYFAVECPYCRRHPEKWATRISETDASSLAPTEQSRLNLARKLGWKALPSNSYSTHKDESSVLVEGTGAGHGLGLCQRGGADMARRGASFAAILRHYYPNTELKQI
jgi:stage II sporulation protein D (peptidoglycan lytic transglycosylase)